MNCDEFSSFYSVWHFGLVDDASASEVSWAYLIMKILVLASILLEKNQFVYQDSLSSGQKDYRSSSNCATDPRSIYLRKVVESEVRYAMNLNGHCWSCQLAIILLELIS